MKFVIVILLTTLLTPVYTQNKCNLGFGAHIGYKSQTNDGGVILELKYTRSFDTYMSLNYAKFCGLGFSLGFDKYFLQSNLQPCFGFAFNKQFGDSFYMGETDINRTDYIIKPTNNYIFGIGARKIFNFDDPNLNDFFAITPFVNYRITSPQAVIIIEEGIYDIERNTKLEQRLNSGFGIGIKVLYFIVK